MNDLLSLFELNKNHSSVLDNHLSFDKRFNWYYSINFLSEDPIFKLNFRETKCANKERHHKCDCSRIIDLKLNFNKIAMINYIKDRADENMHEYISFIINELNISEDSFDVKTRIWYYGEEISGIYLKQDLNNKIYNILASILYLPESDRLDYIKNFGELNE